jgi:uncharacterized membrane protein YgaE (UPF0421/DUF939 family)
VEQLRALLRKTDIQRGVRAALAAGLAWQVAVLLPAPVSDYAYYAPLGAIIAVHPTIADSASAVWRTLLAVLLGLGLAVAVYQTVGVLPGAVVIALLVALSTAVSKWRVLGQHATWVTFAALFMLTLGAEDPGAYILGYTGQLLVGAAIGLLVTTLLFPPLQLTSAREEIAHTRVWLTGYLETTAERLRSGHLDSLDEAVRREAELTAQLDRLREAERTVQRAQRANPRARRYRESAGWIRDESRALDRVAVLMDDLTVLLAELQPHRTAIGPEGAGAAAVADAMDALAATIRHPYHAADGHRPDDRDRAIASADRALDRLVDLLQGRPETDQEGFLALGAVAVGVRRGLLALGAREYGPVET